MQVAQDLSRRFVVKWREISLGGVEVIDRFGEVAVFGAELARSEDNHLQQDLEVFSVPSFKFLIFLNL